MNDENNLTFEESQKEEKNKEGKINNNDNNVKFIYNPELDNKITFIKEKKFIIDKMFELEKEFFGKYSDEFIKNKQRNIKEFLLEIQSKPFITESDLKKLKEFAVDKAGFINNENRKNIYRKLFFYDFQKDEISILQLQLDKINFFDLNNQEKIKQISIQNY